MGRQTEGKKARNGVLGISFGINENRNFHSRAGLQRSKMRFGHRSAAGDFQSKAKERIFPNMWKPTNQPTTPGRPGTPEPEQRPATSTPPAAPAMGEPAAPRPVATTTTADQATIGK